MSFVTSAAEVQAIGSGVHKHARHHYTLRCTEITKRWRAVGRSLSVY